MLITNVHIKSAFACLYMQRGLRSVVIMFISNTLNNLKIYNYMSIVAPLFTIMFIISCFCIYALCLCIVYRVYIVCVCFSAKVTQLPTLVGSISTPSDDKEVTFSCFAKDFAPKMYEITWLKNNNKITENIFGVSNSTIDTNETENGTLYSAASFLSMKSDELSDVDVITCTFLGQNEAGQPDSRNVSLIYRDKCEYISSFIKILSRFDF